MVDPEPLDGELAWASHQHVSPAEIAEDISGEIQTFMIGFIFLTATALVIWLAYRSSRKK